MNNPFKSALISEKSFQKVAQSQYTFVVDKRLSKKEIGQSCRDLFNVTVLSVNTANFKGKVKRTKKSTGQRSDFKKAIITLKKGDKIDLFEVEEKEKSASKQVSK